MVNDKFWYVLRTKPNQEKKAKEQLDKLNIENYVASVYKVKKWSDRNKKIEEILLKSYIFISGSEKERIMALEIPSISRCLFENGKPALVPDWQIQNLKMFLLKAENVFVKNERLEGKKILIKEGPFAGIIGIVNKSLNQNYLAVTLDFLNRSVTTVVSEDLIKIIELFSDDLEDNKIISNKLSDKFLSA